MMLKNNLIIIATLLLLCAVSFVAGYLSKKSGNINAEQIMKIDTVYSLVPSEPIVIMKVRTKIEKISDTIISAHPFIARVDTIVKHDTVNAMFEYPANLFSLIIRSHPDTVITEKIIMNSIKKKNEEWWMKPLVFIGGAVSGYILGKIK